MPAGEVADSPRCGHGFFPELRLSSIVNRLDLPEIFGRSAPVQVDLGCGDGSFLVELARRHADRNFLGVERLLGRVNTTVRRIKRAGLENARVLRIETSYVVRYLLPARSIEAFYLLFPDPWPKRRHQRRRIVTPEFLRAIHDALADGGTFHVSTDQYDYFESINATARESKLFEVHSADTSPDLPVTRFEKHFGQAGAPIYRVALRKTSPVK